MACLQVDENFMCLTQSNANTLHNCELAIHDAEARLLRELPDTLVPREDLKEVRGAVVMSAPHLTTVGQCVAQSDVHPSPPSHPPYSELASEDLPSSRWRVSCSCLWCRFSPCSCLWCRFSP